MRTTKFSLLILTLLIFSSHPTFSISLRRPSDGGHSLLADAHFIDGGHSTTFNFTSTTSFSSNFTFQIGNGGIALLLIPSKFSTNTSFSLSDANRFLGIEFDPNICTISSSRVSNVSRISHLLSNGVNLSSWINYHAILKRIDVRLSKLGDPRPVETLISYRVDLGKMWGGEEVLLGLASSGNGDHERTANVYSWKSEFENVPKWMHSIPVNPLDHSAEGVESSKKGDCFLSGFLFVMGCGALAALVLLLVRSYFVAATQKVRSVSPVDFKYEKIGVVEMKDSETVKK
ncbi:hypothetical protein OSB04_026419 [Centaurea solstitialis]|uniref:Legume lectin domain-containing protein n=1 Tax=Centaurea solstitialis TaxID=347529 RepID=A0AA38SJB9_9ASTR|nr:hypothetical protein OSB04_026419 [Centaurea solstitialis]